MTQKDFEHNKEWVEDIVGIHFNDNDARYDKDGCYFDNIVDSEHKTTLCINNDRSTEIWLHSKTSEAVEIYACNPENINLTLDIFSHIVNYN